MKAASKKNQESLEEEGGVSEFSANEETAMTQSQRKNSKRGQSKRGKQTELGHKGQQAKDTSEKRSKSLKRIGTSSPFRNKDGTLDKRRVDP